MNAENLRTLATYLHSLPENYEGFEMEHYLCIDGKSFTELSPELLVEDTGYPCGTVACAIGHGPKAGIAKSSGEQWWQYGERVFGLDAVESEWNWCFHSDWSCKDNTAKGAAKRIFWLLDKGLPKDSAMQLQSRLYPLCYL